MGNSQTLQDKWEEELKYWDFVEETVDPLFGMIKIYQRKGSKNRVCEINKITNQNLQAKADIKLNHPNILKLYSIFQTKQQNYCSSFSKIVMIFEYAQNDLRRHILQRKLQGNRGFTEPQILKLIHSTASALKYLQEYNLHHLDLQPSNILIDENGEIKILDLSAMNVQINGYTQALLGLRELLHLSPEEVQALEQKKNNIENLDKEKCDVFQLALSVLMATQLDVGLTLYINYDFDTKKLQEILKGISSKYSAKLAYLLQEMSVVDPTKRFTFIETINAIEQILPKEELPENITLLDSPSQNEQLKQETEILKNNQDIFVSETNNIWFASRTKQDDAESQGSQQSVEYNYNIRTMELSKFKDDFSNIKVEQTYTYNPISNQSSFQTALQPNLQRITSRELNEIKKDDKNELPLQQYQEKLNRALSNTSTIQSTVPLNQSENKYISPTESYWEQYKEQLLKERQQFDSLRKKSPLNDANSTKQNSENIQQPTPGYQRNITPTQKLNQQTSQTRFQSSYINSPPMDQQKYLASQKPTRFQSNNNIGFTSPQFQRQYQPFSKQETEILNYKQRDNYQKEGNTLYLNRQGFTNPPIIPVQNLPKSQIRELTPKNGRSTPSHTYQNQDSIQSIDQRIQQVLQRSQQALKLFDKTTSYDQQKQDRYQITEKRSPSPLPTYGQVKPAQKYNEEYIQSILKQAQMEIARSRMNSGNYY